MAHRQESPPVRGRGSKRAVAKQKQETAHVAPRAGARIETTRTTSTARWRNVAPRAGARIETSRYPPARVSRGCRPPCGGADRNYNSCADYVVNAGSPPVRGRGSKRLWWQALSQERRVAPRAGARIETTMENMKFTCFPSPPVRGRGSKLGGGDGRISGMRRPPCGGADRNLSGRHRATDGPSVAPRAGARIETAQPRARRLQGRVAPRAGARIETAAEPYLARG